MSPPIPSVSPGWCIREWNRRLVLMRQHSWILPPGMALWCYGGIRPSRWFLTIGPGISSGSTSQITCRMRGNALPNCIGSGAISLSLVLLTLGVSLSGVTDKFRIRHGWRWAYGTAAMPESFRFSPNNCKASLAERRMLNPSCTSR